MIIPFIAGLVLGKIISKDKEEENPKGLGMPCSGKTKKEISKAAKQATDKVLKLNDWQFSDMPTAAIKEIRSWDVISKSPYSYSFYNDPCKSWDYTTEKTLRISDHWNFRSRGQLHSETDKEVKQGNWILAQYNNGIWKVIKDFGKATKAEMNKRKEDRELYDAISKFNNEIEVQKSYQKHYDYAKKLGVDAKKYRSANAFQKAVREAFVKKAPKVIITKGVYSGSGRNTKKVGTEDYEGKLTNLTKEYASIKNTTGKEFRFKTKTTQEQFNMVNRMDYMFEGIKQLLMFNQKSS